MFLGSIFELSLFIKPKFDMKFFLILALLAITIGCGSSKNAETTSSIVKIQHGTSYGNCVGYCWNEFTLDGNTISESRKATGRGDRSKYPDMNTSKELKTTDWDALLKSIDSNKLKGLAETIGCPDCADGGAEWISVEYSDGTIKKVTIEANAVIPEIDAAMKLLRKYGENYFPKKI